MTDAFKDREQGFEAHYQLEETLDFRAHARANRLLGEWAAEQLGLSGDPAHDYAGSVVTAAVEGHGDATVFDKLLADLGRAGVEITEGRLRLKQEKFLLQAKTQVHEG